MKKYKARVQGRKTGRLERAMSRCIDVHVMKVRVTAVMRVLPLKEIGKPGSIARYESVVAFIRKAGIREPLVVYPQRRVAGKFVLVDGQLHWEAAKNEYRCLIAVDWGEPELEVWNDGKRQR